MPAISLCMIVCNEKKNIGRCLESARELADEIIVVDTGSTDGTKAICEGFGAQVFDFKWISDFSAARNFGISKASCNWLLLLDADEELIIRDAAGLKRYLSGTGYDSIAIRMTHFYGSMPASETRAHFSWGLRLVRNDGKALFTGKIHESVAGRQRIDTTMESMRFLRILHYGYTDEALEHKADRNISMLVNEKNEQSDNPMVDYYLAAEHYRMGMLAEAYQEANTSIALFLQKGLKPPSLVYKLKYDLLLSSLNYGVAYNAIDKAIALYPNYVDLHFYKGILQFSSGEYNEARGTFSYCLILGERNADYLILSGCGSFLALYYLGLCHRKLGELDEAFEAFRQAEAMCPDILTANKIYKHSQDRIADSSYR